MPIMLFNSTAAATEEDRAPCRFKNLEDQYPLEIVIVIYFFHIIRKQVYDMIVISIIETQGRQGLHKKCTLYPTPPMGLLPLQWTLFYTF